MIRVQSRSSGRLTARGPSFGVSAGGLQLALSQLLSPAMCVVLPLYVAFATYTLIHLNALGLDFRGELYPEAKLILHGTNPFPAPGADLSIGANRIWPVPAALLVAPLTVFSTQTASILFAVLLVAALGLALWLLGVTDWRVYGIVALWPPTFAAVQTGNMTIILVLLVAVMWRFRERRFVPGLALGLAVALKLYLWPLGIWLLARRRFASAALAGAIACGSTLLVLPFITLTDYARLMKNLGDTFGPQSYNVVGLIVQSGAGSLATATVVASAVGLLVLALAYRRASLPLALAASLLLSPIVWLHYFVLLVVPLALSRPRLSVAWALPLAFCLCPAEGTKVAAWNTVIGLSHLRDSSSC